MILIRKFKSIIFLLMVIGVVILFPRDGLESTGAPAQITVEGQGDYFVIGESYASNIQVAGFNSRDDKLYLNFTLETTKAVNAGQIATFNYYIEVFNGTSSVLGTSGSYGVPLTQAGLAAAQSVTVANTVITLNTDLTAAYRVVISVKSVEIS